MPTPSNHLEVYKLLPKTNCRDCGQAACLAFAVAVMQGQKGLGDCPHLPGEIVAQTPITDFKAYTEGLKKRMDAYHARVTPYVKQLADSMK